MTREEIALGALQEVGLLAVGDPVQAEDQAFCNRKLDKLLRELGIGALHSQRRSITVAYDAGDSGNATFANDYGQAPVVVRVMDDGQESPPLTIFPVEEWENRVPDKGATGDPTRLYRQGDGTWRLWPIPTDAGTLRIYYSREIPASVAATDLGLSAGWCDALILGVAWEISRTYGLSKDDRQELWNRWRLAKRRQQAADLPEGEISFTVDD